MNHDSPGVNTSLNPEAAPAEKTPVYGAVTPDEAATAPVSDRASEPDALKQTAATSNTAGRSEIPERSAADRLPPSVLRRHKAALAMAQFNAKEDAARRIKELGDFPALEELQKILSLDRPPHRIENVLVR